MVVCQCCVKRELLQHALMPFWCLERLAQCSEFVPGGSVKPPEGAKPGNFSERADFVHKKASRKLDCCLCALTSMQH